MFCFPVTTDSLIPKKKFFLALVVEMGSRTTIVELLF